jgi:hypothetical protein
MNDGMGAQFEKAIGLALQEYCDVSDLDVTDIDISDVATDVLTLTQAYLCYRQASQPMMYNQT